MLEHCLKYQPRRDRKAGGHGPTFLNYFGSITDWKQVLPRICKTPENNIMICLVCVLVVAHLCEVSAQAAGTATAVVPLAHPDQAPYLEFSAEYGQSATVGRWRNGHFSYLVVGAPEGPGIFMSSVGGDNSSVLGEPCFKSGSDIEIDAGTSSEFGYAVAAVHGVTIGSEGEAPVLVVGAPLEPKKTGSNVFTGAVHAITMNGSCIVLNS